MSRYIDADEIKYERATVDTKHGYVEACVAYWSDIQIIPTADVVGVIRCADCVYRPCEMMPYSYDFDYCSYGERADT